MRKIYPTFAATLAVLLLNLAASDSGWEPPAEIARQQIIEASKTVLAMPDLKLKVKEDIFRLRVLGLDWDLGAMVWEPEDSSRIPVGPEGKKIGVFLIHGGAGDHRGMDKTARLLAGKFGYRVVAMTYPGNLYLLDPSHNWPGDSIRTDGSVRTPIYNKDIQITRDQYDVVEDKSLRPKYGTLILACAKEGTEFYNRMNSWPAAFEESGKDLMRRYFPVGEYSIYIHGHSTGGPFSYMFTQRVPNIVGVLGMDSSPFGYIYRKQGRPSGDPSGKTYGDVPFNCLVIRTWRDRARYAGPEALMKEGPDALMRLPMLMEEVMESWAKGTTGPNMKAEGMIHFGSEDNLRAAAKASAKRLNMTPQQTEKHIERYVSFIRELRGPDVKPVPPVIMGMAAASADHMPENYKKITLPMFAAMKPAPKVRMVQFGAGVHGYTRPEEDLPMGTFPAVAKLWHDSIMKGYYADYARQWSTRKD